VRTGVLAIPIDCDVIAGAQFQPVRTRTAIRGVVAAATVEAVVAGEAEQLIISAFAGQAIVLASADQDVVKIAAIGPLVLGTFRHCGFLRFGREKIRADRVFPTDGSHDPRSRRPSNGVRGPLQALRPALK
jgi:hypothetical protein